MKKRFVLSEDELDKLLDFLEEKTKEKKIILLEGNLGSGKTTLVKKFAKRLGIEEATSPTFSIEHVYNGKIYHYDLYQTPLEKFLELGLFEELEKDGIHFIEWPDENLKELLKNMGLEFIEIKIMPKNNKREYLVISH